MDDQELHIAEHADGYHRRGERRRICDLVYQQDSENELRKDDGKQDGRAGEISTKP